jgi:hypothetical protein
LDQTRDGILLAYVSDDDTCSSTRPDRDPATAALSVRVPTAEQCAAFDQPLAARRRLGLEPGRAVGNVGA